MTDAKAKFKKINWLLFTQLVEIFDAETDAQIAKECADLMSILINYLEDMGYNPVEVYEKRIGSKADQVASIKAKYDMKWKQIKEEMDKDEKA